MINHGNRSQGLPLFARRKQTAAKPLVLDAPIHSDLSRNFRRQCHKQTNRRVKSIAHMREQCSRVRSRHHYANSAH